MDEESMPPFESLIQSRLGRKEFVEKYHISAFGINFSYLFGIGPPIMDEMLGIGDITRIWNDIIEPHELLSAARRMNRHRLLRISKRVRFSTDDEVRNAAKAFIKKRGGLWKLFLSW